MNTQNAAYWVQRLTLQPHPEGGYYKEMFRSEQQVNRVGETAIKQACTSIYYLLEGEDFSGFHRLVSDELWYFHAGSPLYIHMIDASGNYFLQELSASDTGSLSVIIPGGAWFASEIPSKEGFSLVSCAVAPGFDFSEFEMAVKEDMITTYPQFSELFNRLCR
ncbi:cupin domain-containing protein [Mucilaginibacter sp. NFX135]|uniref:cupin domain-containing protein n=1 Tax=Mucilaginibacter sp. NFX135 TaxID=3402687 RepID=UPI003AFB0BD0